MKRARIALITCRNARSCEKHVRVAFRPIVHAMNADGADLARRERTLDTNGFTTSMIGAACA